LLKNKQLSVKGYPIVAGFDSSINRIELLQTEIPLYPLHEIAEIVREERIWMAILTTAKDHTQEAVQRLIEGGIRGILNLTSEILISTTESVQIRNLGLIEELRVLAATLGMAEQGEANANSP